MCKTTVKTFNADVKINGLGNSAKQPNVTGFQQKWKRTTIFNSPHFRIFIWIYNNPEIIFFRRDRHQNTVKGWYGQHLYLLQVLNGKFVWGMCFIAGSIHQKGDHRLLWGKHSVKKRGASLWGAFGALHCPEWPSKTFQNLQNVNKCHLSPWDCVGENVLTIKWLEMGNPSCLVWPSLPKTFHNLEHFFRIYIRALKDTCVTFHLSHVCTLLHFRQTSQSQRDETFIFPAV